MSGNKDKEVQALIDENARLRTIITQQAEQLARQAEQITVLTQRIAELEERLRKNSRNSSKPPSSDLPKSVNEDKKPRSGRNRGGQPGHKGKQRELLPPEQVDKVVDIKPDTCGQCGHSLGGMDRKPWRHQVTEVPPIRPHVTEYRLHMLSCPSCGKQNFGRLPEDIPQGAFGFRLQGLVALCTGTYRLSKRTVLALLKDVLGVEMALGSVSQCEKTVSAALAAPVDEARQFVQAQPVANVDETSWIEDKKRSWLWVAVTALVSVFMIHRSRGGRAAAALLGGFAGVLGSDRWSVYNAWGLDQHQLCWAHLIRDFQAMFERQGDSARIGAGLLATAKEIFHLWHGFCGGQWDRETMQQRAGPLMETVKSLLKEGVACSDGKTAGTCRQLLKRFPALWTFLRVPGVEPTNNAAERALRKGVLWRKGSFGTDSAEGSRFAERIMTVVATCRQQKRNVLDFLVSALMANHGGHKAPSLLPKYSPAVAKAA